MKLVFQPANSPDLNVLYVDFFNAVQSLQHTSAPKNVDNLVLAVEKSFNDLPRVKLDNIFFTLRKVVEFSIIHNGGDDYKLPRMSKPAY